MQIITKPTWKTGPHGSGWFAEFRDGGRTFQVSKLDGETGWTVDAQFTGPTGLLPVFVNGFGARYLRTYRLTDVAGRQLDQAR